jgi:hypothetical protein
MDGEKNFPTLWNEWAKIEVSPEHSELFAEIAGELNYRRLKSMEQRDVYLTDFRKGWSGGARDSDNRGLAGGTPPQDYVDRWYQINGSECSSKGSKINQKDYSASIGGVTVQASDVVCTLQKSVALIQLFDPAEVRALGQSLIAAADQMTAAPTYPATPVGTDNHASSSFSYSQNAKVFNDDRPAAVAARKANEQRMQYSLENERKAAMDRAFQRLQSIGRRY